MTEYSVRDGVAIIKLDNPPVNALGSKVRSGLDKHLKQANHDSEVTAVVIVGKGGKFCAGADIKEFGGGAKGPWITDIGDYCDKMRKPVVAAIEGMALGGGLEVALFCHYRIAVKTARVGQPEVQIGLIPGGGGTIRLPKAAGLKNALDIITTGNHVPAEKALKMGIIDQIVSGDIIEEGIKFAKSKIHIDTSIVCLRNKHVKVDGDVDKVAEAAMTKVKSKYRGAIAPIFCVRSVMNSARLPYQRGIDLEHEYFRDLQTSSQSQAMRYAFFAERAITKWQLPSGGNYRTKPLPVRSAGVIGAGTMGGGIALCLVTSGIPCILVEQSKEFLDKGMEIIKTQLMGTVRLGKMTADQAKQCMGILRSSVNIDDLKDVDLVIEAVFEDLKLKREIFEKLDRICKPSTILCTNTSTLDIDSIATATKRQDKVVGTHFFAPSYIMKLL
ncbi:peroxisomal bifunctional enzyme-like, partial [Ruditapes philippinarum]|uniref:peroxisomal bifunctional enzyme-like n=1 Tax=Ruditapes philippinarum TaxID=129788 RepID=UPI00295B7DB7